MKMVITTKTDIDLEFDSSNKYMGIYLKSPHIQTPIHKCMVIKNYKIENQAILILYVDKYGFNRTTFYIPYTKTYQDALYRFAPHLYTSNIAERLVLYGELTPTSFGIDAVRCGSGPNNMVENLEWFDQILFNHYNEDLDVEPHKIYIKEFITHPQKDSLYIPSTI
jgi:hypothetical protein